MTSLSSTRSSTSDSSLTSTLGEAATGTSNSRASNVGSATTSSNPASTTAAARSGGSSAPIGAIVGGVVGGVAVIALFALGLVLLLRKRRHHQGQGSDQYTAIYPAGGNPSQQPPSQPAMQQQFQQSHPQPTPSPAIYAAAAPVMDNRSSIAKPSPVSTAQPFYGPSTAGSPPPPQSQSPGAILPAYQATNTNTSTNPAAATQPISPTTPDAPQQQRPGSYANPSYQNQVQPAYHQHDGHYYEMPTVKSDRELRELA